MTNRDRIITTKRVGHMPEIANPSRRGGRLGRHVEHDERSRDYAFTSDKLGTLTSVVHQRHTPVYDQGSLGSCTGNAAAGVLGTDPFFDTLTLSQQAVLMSAREGEQGAITLYKTATQLDPIPGHYPPEDTGSTGLAVAKAARAGGLISGYQWAFSLDTALRALEVTPIIVGVPWYDSFDQPDRVTGYVTISADAQVRGGHEFELAGLDVEAQTVLAYNSWGPDWGVNGTFRLSFATLGRLLSEQGDATVFVPTSRPAPTPTPVPPVDPVKRADDALDAAFVEWRHIHGRV